MPETIARKNLGEVVAERIKQYIIDHKLKPGDRLPTEQEFADRFGVSRISTREATKALGFLGIIDAAPRRGLAVGQVNMKRLTNYLGFHLAIGDYPASQLLDGRIVIETGILPHLIKQMSADPELHAKLTAVADRIRVAKTLDDRIVADVAFHRALLDASGIQPLVAFHDLLTIFFDRFRRSLAEADWDNGARQHQELLDLVRAGDLGRAVELLSKHLDCHRKLCQ